MGKGIGKIIHSDRTFDIIVNFLGAVIVLIVLVPLIFVLAASFSDPDMVIKGKVLFLPKGFTVKPILWSLKIRIFGRAFATPVSTR